MSATLYREGADLDTLLAELDAEYPGQVRVLEVVHPREGGFLGFFAKQRVAVHYRLIDDAGAPAAVGAGDTSSVVADSSADSGMPDLLAADDFAELLAEISATRRAASYDVSAHDNDTVEFSSAAVPAPQPAEQPATVSTPAASTPLAMPGKIAARRFLLAQQAAEAGYESQSAVAAATAVSQARPIPPLPAVTAPAAASESAPNEELSPVVAAALSATRPAANLPVEIDELLTSLRIPQQAAASRTVGASPRTALVAAARTGTITASAPAFEPAYEPAYKPAYEPAAEPEPAPATPAAMSASPPAAAQPQVAPDSGLADFLRLGGANIPPSPEPVRGSIAPWTPPVMKTDDSTPILGRRSQRMQAADPATSNNEAAAGQAAPDPLMQPPASLSTATTATAAEPLVAGIMAAPAADSPLFGPTEGRLTLRRKLLELGVPLEQVPTNTPHPYAAVESLVEHWDTSYPIPTAAGEVLILAGPSADISAVRDSLVGAQYFANSQVWGYRMSAITAERAIMSADHAEQLTRQWRDESSPAALVLVATDQIPSWASGPRAIIDALAGNSVWAAIDATRKTADSRAFIDRLGTVDALMVTGSTESGSPATIWELERPVAFIDGHASSDSAWAVLLLDKLEEIA